MLYLKGRESLYVLYVYCRDTSTYTMILKPQKFRHVRLLLIVSVKRVSEILFNA